MTKTCKTQTGSKARPDAPGSGAAGLLWRALLSLTSQAEESGSFPPVPWF